MGDFDGVEVLALDVLDEGDFHQAVVGEVLNDDGDFLEAGDLGGTETAFAGDQLVVAGGFADDEGLDDAVLADGLGQFLEALGLEDGAGLEGVRLDVGSGDADGAGRGSGLLADEVGDRRGLVGAQEGIEALAEGLTRVIRLIAHGRGFPWRV